MRRSRVDNSRSFSCKYHVSIGYDGGGVVGRFHSLKIQVSTVIFSQNYKFLKLQGLHSLDQQVLQPCRKDNLNIIIKAQISKQFVFVTVCG
jgi:hypothetical protein